MMKTLKVNLIRHGLTDANLNGTYTGRADIPVNSAGIKELKYIKKNFRFDEVDAVVTSPLTRCKQTAAILYPGKEILPYDGLIEYDFGEFEGKTAKELESDKRYAEWLGSAGEAKAPFGESNDEFAARVTGAFKMLVDGLLKTDMREVSVITHGGVIMTLLSFFGIPQKPMHEWICNPGKGYTLRIDSTLWAMEPKAEVLSVFPKKNYKAVIFDLDGTLLNTLEDLKNSVNFALKSISAPECTLAQVREYVGNGIKNLMIKAVPGGEENPEFERAFSAFKEHYSANNCVLTVPYDGVTGLICGLYERGVKMAVVSNKIDSSVKRLNRIFFEPEISVAIGESPGLRRKPYPDSVNKALELLGVTADEALYVGDSEVDILTARNVGMDCVSVLWGFRDRDVLTEAGASAFAYTPEEILTLF